MLTKMLSQTDGNDVATSYKVTSPLCRVSYHNSKMDTRKLYYVYFAFPTWQGYDILYVTLKANLKFNQFWVNRGSICLSVTEVKIGIIICKIDRISIYQVFHAVFHKCLAICF